MAEATTQMLIDADGAPRDRIVGFETEYGGWMRYPTGEEEGEDGKLRPFETFDAGHAMRAGELHWGHMEEFKSNGSRRYLDVGAHPELSTAEEISFTGAANRLLAGHVEMARVFDPAQNVVLDRLGIEEVVLAANTEDTKGNSWASHENYLALRALSPSDYNDALVAHYLSRIVWSGAGAVLRLRRQSDAYTFTLSEKAEHIWEPINNQTTQCRPIVNQRDEPLADGSKWRRIHMTSGESVMSSFTNALRLASGSIVLRACELGVDFSDLETLNPVRAMRTISRDSSLQIDVPLTDGGTITGLGLQRKIAERSLEAAKNADYLTEQERYWGEEWIRLLDDLEADPMKCTDRLDWPIKLKAVEREVEAKKGKGEKVLNIAIQKALHYHQLLPEEGLGMQLVRRAHFPNSPTHDQLETGLPLPQTRAHMRGQALTRLLEIGLYPETVDWFKMYVEVGMSFEKFSMPDPYQTTDTRLEAYLGRLEKKLAKQT